MFKIKTLRINDLKQIEGICNDKELISILRKNELLCILQPIIPYNLRTFPSAHLAIEEKNILGFILLKCSSKASNTWKIDNVFVQDNLRNEGVGEELLRYVLSVYGSYGVEHFLAEVESTNHAALSLFHRCGFRRYSKVYFYEKEIDPSKLEETFVCLLDKEFSIRSQTYNDLTDLEKLELSSIPPDLRHAIGRSKDYFKERKNSHVLIEKNRHIIIGWFNIEKFSDEHYFIELLLSPGWTHLYTQLLSTMIFDLIANRSQKFKLTIKVNDYTRELTQILSDMRFSACEVRELLVRTIWQRVKGKKEKLAKVGFPYAAPT